MAVLEWVGIVAAIWFVASVLVATGWALMKRNTNGDPQVDELTDLVAVLTVTATTATVSLTTEEYAATGIEQVERYLNEVS